MALKKSVVNITGPLIRILGDRFSFNVKVAVLETLGLLLGKVSTMSRSGSEGEGHCKDFMLKTQALLSSKVNPFLIH